MSPGACKHGATCNEVVRFPAGHNREGGHGNDLNENSIENDHSFSQLSAECVGLGPRSVQK